MIKRLIRLFSLRGGTSFAVTMMLLLTLTILFSMAWSKWGPAITKSEKYQLRLESLRVTNPPEWIHADVKATVFRDGSLGQLSVLDSRLAVKVARAFELNPWVSRVKWVRKRYPSDVEVELEYRRPIAMVEVRNDDEMGLLPVDAQSVLLDPRDFSENMAQKFLRIRVDFRYPMGVVGTKWEDDRVAQAAQIAEALESVDWKKIGIHRVVAVSMSSGPTTTRKQVRPHDFYLLTSDDLKIHWGRAPGSERESEPAAKTKLAWLEELTRVKGRLSRNVIQGELDLRQSEIRVVAPHPRQPLVRPTSSGH